MDTPPRKKLDHEPPFWVKPEADYFITVCGEPRGNNQFCNSVVGPIVLESIRNRHERGVWYCHLAVIMPDHIHLLLNFPGDKSISRIMGEWKGWLGRHRGISWQRNFFDHRIRNDEQDRNKSDYVFNNPVRAGLIDKPEIWPYFWMPTL